MLRSQSLERPGGKAWRQGLEARSGGVEDVYTDGTALRTAKP